MRVIVAVSCLLLLFQSVCSQSGSDEAWVDPHAVWSHWVTVENTNEDSCSQCQCQGLTEKSQATIEDAVALTYFKKFVNSLFLRKNLEYDGTSMLYKRSLLFTLLPDHLDELEAVRDARDMDVVLSKILEKAEAAPLFAGMAGCSYAHRGQGMLTLIRDIFKDLLELLRISEVQFLLKVVLAVAVGWLVHKRFRLRLMSIILGGVFLFGYFYTYLECNRKLKVEAMIEIIDQHDPSTYQIAWISRLWSWVGRESAQVQQKRTLRKSAALNLDICRPDHVFIMYFNDLFLMQLETLLEKISQAMSKLSADMPFPFSVLAPFALVALVCYIIKLTFKYVITPKAWMGLIHSHSSRASQPAAVANEGGGDRISGENLKMLLNVMHVSGVQKLPQLPAVSGVQELVEPLEDPAAIESKKLNASSNDSRDSTAEAGFTLIDDPDDGDNIVNV